MVMKVVGSAQALAHDRPIAGKGGLQQHCISEPRMKSSSLGKRWEMITGGLMFNTALAFSQYFEGGKK